MAAMAATGTRTSGDVRLESEKRSKATLLSPSHQITIYEYTPLATYRAAPSPCSRVRE
jgi:hypothetical protein